jgi:hypothetical protein
VNVGTTSNIHRDPSAATGEGTQAGNLNRSSRLITLTDWVAGTSPLVTEFNGAAVSALAGEESAFQTDGVTFRTASAPVAPSGFSVLGTFDDGTTFNVAADEDGYINDDGVIGGINYQSGVVELRFGTPTADPVDEEAGIIDLSELGVPGVTNVELRPVRADTLRYNAVTYSYIPLDADILGLDPVRLPADGRVPIFRPGTVVVVHHTDETAPDTVANSDVINLGRIRLSRVRVIGANGLTIESGFTVNKLAGTVTFTDVTGYSQPVTIEHRIEDATLLRDAQISGLLRFSRPMTHDYPVGSYVSSALLIGDMRARVSSVYDQTTWTSVWSNDLIGSAATASYDQINYPPVIENLGAVTERWALVFAGSTNFNIIGEHFGQVGASNTASGAAPLNPATGTPYFELESLGFGTGWSAGNVIRVNTIGAQAPIWVARVVQQGEPTVLDDSFTMVVRGDVDTP